MKAHISIGLLVLALFGCSEKNTEERMVDLSTFENKMSYCLGADQAQMILRSGDPNLDQLDFEAINSGFQVGLESQDELAGGCDEILMKMYGPYGQDLDTSMLTPGSECIGKFSGAVFMDNWTKKQMMDKINLDIVKIGFEDGLKKRDTLVQKDERFEIVSNLYSDLNKKFGQIMLDSAKTLPNTQVLDQGVVLQTLEAGSGPKPTATDDVQVDYILTNAYGDTVDNSIARLEQTGRKIPPFSLSTMMPGWKIAFPNMQKGGKYRLFVPWQAAFGAERGFESLCFYIELKEFGPEGSMAPEQPMDMN